jgi:hypothetical protein
MPNLLYDLSVVPMLRALRNLDAILGKAEAYAAADDGIDPATLIQARLYPNMRPLVFQVRTCTDTAKGAVARLAGREIPSWADDEASFADLHARLGKAIGYLSGYKPEDFDGAAERTIELKLGPNQVKFTGASYLANFVLPNFFFHVTTAYNILRHNGVVIGKRDFLGPA